jgi:transposase
MSTDHQPTSRRPALALSSDDYEFLRRLSLRPDKDDRLARRARFLLAFAHGMKITDAARLAGFSRPVAYRWLERVASAGVRAGIADKPYEKSDRPEGSLQWLAELTSKRPADFGSQGESWTCDALARYVRSHATREGHPDLSRITSGGLRRILNAEGINPEEQRHC